LEARFVIYITELYTYMKAVRDMQRAFAQIKPEAAGSGESTASVDDWHEAVRNIVYMLYLGLESARYAICLLVEFEPEQMERTIVVLISELEAYRFLCSQFTGDDVRRQRILLRERDYRKLVPLLIEFVKDKANAEAREPPLGGAHWEPASVLLRELKKRYLLALPETAGQ
jgi:hypothetical protein